MTAVERVEHEARELAEAIKQAQEEGVGPAILLPALMVVFREAGMFSGSLSDLGLSGLSS